MGLFLANICHVGSLSDFWASIGIGNDLFQTKVLCTCCWKYHINLMKRAEWFSGEENGFLFAKEWLWISLLLTPKYGQSSPNIHVHYYSSFLLIFVHRNASIYHFASVDNFIINTFTFPILHQFTFWSKVQVSSCSKYMINHQYHQYIPSHPAFSVLPEAELASKYIVHLISYFPTVFLCHLSFDPKNIVWAVRSVQWSEENNICKTLPTHHDKRITSMIIIAISQCVRSVSKCHVCDINLYVSEIFQSLSDPAPSVYHQVQCIWDISPCTTG